MDNLKEILEELKILMNCPSVSSDKQMNKKLLDEVKTRLPKNLFIKDYEFEGHSSLVIANTKDTAYDIVFCAHVDVVPADTYRFSEDEKNVYGRGAVDMKGSVAVILTLFKHLNTKKKIALFLTSDEEIAGHCARELVNLYPNINLAVVPDGGKNFQVIYKQKGLFQLKLEVKTTSAHASQPYNGINAINELYSCYEKLLKKYPLPKNDDDFQTSINLSKLEGGKALNQVPDEAVMYLDIRYVPECNTDEILDEINKINANIKVTVIEKGLAFATDINNKYIEKYLKISKEILGYKPEIIKNVATSDAIYFADKNIPTVLTNPIGDNPHCPNEYVNKESLLNLYKIFKKLIEEW